MSVVVVNLNVGPDSFSVACKLRDTLAVEISNMHHETHQKSRSSPKLRISMFAPSSAPSFYHSHSYSSPTSCSIPGSAMDGKLGGVKARLQAALTSPELLASSVQEPADSSSKFEEPYYQRRGLLEVKVEGADFFKHADFENATILQNDKRDSFGNLKLEFEVASEAYLQFMWFVHVCLDLQNYLQLQGKPVAIFPDEAMEPLPSWRNKGGVRPDIG